MSYGWLEIDFYLVLFVVVVIFEGFFIVMIVIFVFGVLRMLKCKVIVKKLFSVEVLGSVSVICFDKIGMWLFLFLIF